MKLYLVRFNSDFIPGIYVTSEDMAGALEKTKNKINGLLARRLIKPNERDILQIEKIATSEIEPEFKYLFLE